MNDKALLKLVVNEKTGKGVNLLWKLKKDLEYFFNMRMREQESKMKELASKIDLEAMQSKQKTKLQSELAEFGKPQNPFSIDVQY